MRMVAMVLFLFSLNAGASGYPRLETESSKMFRFGIKRKIPQLGPGVRGCCGFGNHSRINFFPLVVVNQTVGEEDIGEHRYRNRGMFLAKKERNGELFTCRAGFLDTAHIRHAADWTAYLARAVELFHETGGTIPLKWEGGDRTLTIHPSPKKLRAEHVVRLAQRIAYDTSVWHEIMTWYTTSVTALFPESSSSFAPEDNYSNLLGTYISAIALMDSSSDYEKSMDKYLERFFRSFGALDRDGTIRAFDLIDQKWWDSNAGIPGPLLLLKRHMNSYPQVTPWLVGERKELGCTGEERAEDVTLEVPEYLEFKDGEKLKITDLYELEVTPKVEDMDIPSILEREGQTVSHRELPGMVENVAESIESFYEEQGIFNIFSIGE